METIDRKFMWAFMPQFGMNMWGDIVSAPKRDGIQTRILTDEEFAVIGRPGYNSRQKVRFDEVLWRSLSARLRSAGCNLLLLDLGELPVYPSHPELAVEGSWPADKLSAEVDRLKGMGFEVIPKLNFSCCHDAWLKEYARMISTSEYYAVVRDLVRDVHEMFGAPRFIHLGLDEEDIYEYQSRSTSIVRMRQGELWWHDALFMIREVERLGSRAWVWSDYIRRHPLEEFVRRMPKSVLQSPWTYRTENPSFEDPLVKIFKTLADAGYDVVPCGSNCYGVRENFPAMARFCMDNLPADRYAGMLFAPWVATREPYGRLLFEAADLMAEARRRCS